MSTAINPSEMFIFYSNLHHNVLDVFNENNLQIMTPSHLVDPLEPKVVAQDQWFAKPAAQPSIGKKTTGSDRQVNTEQRPR